MDSAKVNRLTETTVTVRSPDDLPPEYFNVTFAPVAGGKPLTMLVSTEPANPLYILDRLPLLIESVFARGFIAGIESQSRQARE